MGNFKLSLPAEVREALEKLSASGHEAWLVGGVRDLLLHRKVHDWDLCTDATPSEIKEVFSGYSLNCVGEKYGTITVHYGPLFLDITTFRKEGAYSDHRHPKEVTFTKDLFEDLKRRDFTINAIVYHPEKGFRDFFCGRRDLKKRWIRAIGNADERFDQDAVRILRALRFAAVLGFEIEEKTKEAIHRNKHLLKEIAEERILPEFTRMLCGKHIRSVLTEFSDVIGTLVPEILPAVGFSQHSPFHQYDVWQHTVHAVSYGEATPEIRLALFFHDISKPGGLTLDESGRGHFYAHPKKSAVIARDVMTRMKFPTRQIEKVCLLVYHHDSHPAGRGDVKRLLSQVGKENFFPLIRVMEADARAHSKWTVKRRLAQVQNLRAMGEDVLNSGECYLLRDLAINGNDLAAKGVKGQRIGYLLNLALQNVISGKWENQKDLLLSELEKNNW